MELLQKLRVNREKPLWLINAPDTSRTYFDDLELKTRLGKEKPLGQLILFAYDSKELAEYLHRLESYIAHETLFWICYPKKSGSISSDLILMESWDVVTRSGYRGQTSASIDDDWSGLRVTNAPLKKPSDCDVPMAERKHEFIDYATRTVTLPPDAIAAFKKHAGITEFFHTLSFTDKREFVLSVTGAKKRRHTPPQA